RNLPPSSTTPNFEPTTPVASPGLLSVPSTNIPLGRGGYVPPGIGTNQNPNPNPNPMPRLSLRRNSQSRAAALGLRYRVVVNVNNAAQTYKLRSLVPDTFSTNINGNSVMQAGAFRSRLEADQLLKVLRNNGLNAKIILIR
ncbi:MAG: SPOR domain-containing protein, partial [Okeania sp. SIO3B3]|nr:SPOR domain-containing protein [Okeania sp. SIO3B3]